MDKVTTGQWCEMAVLHRDGHSADGIAEKLGISRASVYRWLKSPVPPGSVPPDERARGVSGQLWDTVHALEAQNLSRAQIAARTGYSYTTICRYARSRRPDNDDPPREHQQVKTPEWHTRAEAMLAEGRPYNEIADACHISRTTAYAFCAIRQPRPRRRREPKAARVKQVPHLDHDGVVRWRRQS